VSLARARARDAAVDETEPVKTTSGAPVIVTGVTK
jgi:hypothetical protein